MGTKVSVILPVYNVSDYLRQCMDSIVGQTLKDIEIICVDDGSTDDSLAILKEYEAKDQRETKVLRSRPESIFHFWIPMISLSRTCWKRHGARLTRPELR